MSVLKWSPEPWTCYQGLATRVTALTLAFVYLFVSEVGSHCIPEAGLELMMVYSQPPQYCSLLAEGLEMKSKALNKLYILHSRHV